MHAFARLERYAATVEGHPFADEGEQILAAWIAGIFHDYQARRFVAALGDCQKGAHPQSGDRLFVQHFKLQGVFAGDLRRLRRHFRGSHMVGGVIDEIAGEVYGGCYRLPTADAGGYRRDLLGVIFDDIKILGENYLVFFGFIAAETVVAQQRTLYERLRRRLRVETGLTGPMDHCGDFAGVELLSGSDGSSGYAPQTVKGEVLLLAEAEENNLPGANAGTNVEDRSGSVLACASVAADEGGYLPVEG